MFRWGALLALKARVEIAEGHCDIAPCTIASGLAFNHHIAAGPFLTHPFMATAADQLMFDQIDELITLPDAELVLVLDRFPPVCQLPSGHGERVTADRAPWCQSWPTLVALRQRPIGPHFSPRFMLGWKASGR